MCNCGWAEVVRWMTAFLASVALAAGAAAAAAPAISISDLAHYDAQKKFAHLGNGLTLAYLDVGPRTAPAVVLIHGYTDSARDWQPIVPLLSTTFRLIVVDLRGHGASDKPGCCYTRFDFADDVKRLLSHLNIATASIVGHSLGSLVAQTFAELWPQATRKLILISSTGTAFGDDSSADMPEWLKSVAELRDPIDPESAFMHAWWHESETYNSPQFVERQRRAAAAIPARVWQAISDQCLQHTDLKFMLPRITAPTLLVWGGRDTLVGEAGRAALRTGIANSVVQDFPALGHDLFWEDPTAVTDALREFLNQP
jgi:pimeloyl-ACP methyl ester carboxylesterase